MPFDGGYLHKIAQELDPFIGARLDKVAQPSRECLVLSLRGAGAAGRLLVTTGSRPKAHLTGNAPENPAAPPMFCMLLRKRLSGGRLTAVEQPGLDRLLYLRFSCYNELGDRETLSIVLELIGRGSNVVLLDGGGRVIDAARRVDFADSESRQILPGITYLPPAPQSKTDINAVTVEEACEKVLSLGELPLSKALLDCFQGLSPLVARELSFRCCGSADREAGGLDVGERKKLSEALGMLKNSLAPGGGRPCMVYGGGNVGAEGVPYDFSYLPLTQFPSCCEIRFFDSFSAVPDAFFGEKDREEGIRRRKTELKKSVTAVRDRLARKLAVRLNEQQDCGNREQLRRCGDIVSANLSRISKGDRLLKAEDFYNDNAPTEIPLDVKLSPSGNAKKYYNEYRKAANAHRLLDGLIADCRAELDYAESALESLERAGTGAELAEIAGELSAQGLIRGPSAAGGDARRKKNTGAAGGRKPAGPKPLPPLEYTSTDGFTILCGRNNTQNDALTHRTAVKGDIWLHLQKAPGSHVVIQSGGRPVPDSTVEQAANIAACQSSAKDSPRAAVDYTDVKNVKKPSGSKPGFAVYDTYNTAYIAPDREAAEKLKRKRENTK